MSIVRPKYVLLGGSLIFVFILVSLAQEMNRRWQYQQEVDRLVQSAAELQRNVVELENLNNYFRTPEYQEREARAKLNYRAPGEKVVLIPHGQEPSTSATQEVKADEPASIPILWWKIFFVDQ